jgi:hypothetical protein
MVSLLAGSISLTKINTVHAVFLIPVLSVCRMQFIFFFPSALRAQGLTPHRQALYHLSHIHRTFAFSLFFR